MSIEEKRKSGFDLLRKNIDNKPGLSEFSLSKQ